MLEKVGIRECKVFRSKYYPQGWSCILYTSAEPTTVQKEKKNKAMPIRQVEHQVVSSLSQPMSKDVYKRQVRVKPQPGHPTEE